jgi:hypothetical protein
MERDLLLDTDWVDRRERAALEANLLPRIVRFARAHAGNPGLDAEAIAAAHGISAARLAAVWAPMGCDLAEWLDIQSQRSGILGEGA